jgi:competence protein ComEA
MIRNAILAVAFVLAAPAFAETPAIRPMTAAPVATPAPAPVPAPSAKMATEAQRLDLNSATLEQLMSVKGFDKSIAEAIVKGRPFKTIDDLTTRKIVTGDVLATVKDQLIVR